MNKTIYLCLLAIIFFSFESAGQYHLTTVTWSDPHDTTIVCRRDSVDVRTNTYAPGLTVKVYWGDGTTMTHSVLNGTGYGYATFDSAFYESPGVYTQKYVLLDGGLAVDSLVSTHDYHFCNTFIIKCFYDTLGTGVYDGTEKLIDFPIDIQISKNGVVIDTQTILTGIYYWIRSSSVGDVYMFKIVSIPPGVYVTNPTPYILDTVKYQDNYNTKYIGVNCSGTTGFDLGIYSTNSMCRGEHMSRGIYATNRPCNLENAIVTLHYSPKYVYTGEADPLPTTVTANMLTWNLSYQDVNSLLGIYYRLEYNPATGTLTRGDTVHSYYTITPITGDINPSNNSEFVIDTVTRSSDPNDMVVSPTGYIHPGTQLTYTINFENTGTDTAFNVSVYDTLSDNVDVHSLKLQMASAPMNIAILYYGGHNIAKFDFPNINLPDSTHHGLCDGTVMFTVNALNGLPNGTTIFNHAGIFFDYNPVVMTDTVENIIGTPTYAANLSQISNASIRPNPATDEVSIVATEGIFNSYMVTNTIGQVLLQGPVANSVEQVDIKQLPSGLYLIVLKGDYGDKVMKFVKM